MFIWGRAFNGSIQIVKHLFKVCQEVPFESEPCEAGIETAQKWLVKVKISVCFPLKIRVSLHSRLPEKLG